MVEGEFEDAIGAKTVRSSHGDFGLVVQALHDATGKQLVTVQVLVSLFLDKSPRIVYRMVDECESVSPENAEASLGESSSALEPAQP